MHVDGPLGRRPVDAPGAVQQLPPGEHPLRFGHHRQQDLVLGRSAFHGRAVADHLVPRRVHRDSGGMDDRIVALFGGRASTAPQHGTDAGHQLARTVRLGHVVVRAELQAEQYVVLRGAGGQHENGNVIVLPQHPAHPEAVDHREHQVQDDEVRTVAPSLVESRPSVMDHGGGVALLQQ